jgi:hypothetical protein
VTRAIEEVEAACGVGLGKPVRDRVPGEHAGRQERESKKPDEAASGHASMMPGRALSPELTFLVAERGGIEGEPKGW